MPRSGPRKWRTAFLSKSPPAPQVDRSGPGQGTRRASRRVFVVFHESEILGAGVSVLGALDLLTANGWTASGWFPGSGPLIERAEPMFETLSWRARPIAVSLAGWRRHPGVRARFGDTPSYVRDFRRALLEAQPDVVHVNSLQCLPEAGVARALGFPVVLQVHELPDPGLKRELALAAAARIANVLVAVSVAVRRMLEARSGRTPILTVHNGVRPTAPVRRAASRFIVGTIGHVSWTKGTDLFVRAAEATLVDCGEILFEHVGPRRLWDDDSFDDLVEHLASSPALRGRISFLGRQSGSDALRRWQIFMLPSRMEAFPLSTLEAMSAGLPVIASSVGGVPEQIINRETGILVPPESPEALADAIVRLHDDPALRERLGEAARRRVATHFPLQLQAQGLERAYLLALEGGKGTRRGRRGSSAR